MIPTAAHRRLPTERRSITHKFRIAELKGYVTVGLFEDGRPGELFLRVDKVGTLAAGLCSALSLVISLALQHGVPLKLLVSKLQHTRFEPMGITSSAEIPLASSILDYVAHWLALKFPLEFEA